MCSNGTGNSYTYSALLKHQIRLLRLDLTYKSTLHGALHSAPLSELKHVNSHDGSSFHALSFAWINHQSEVGSTHEILLNGQGTVTITIDLARALARIIQLQQQTGVHNPLWVDQICIDQCNEVEKVSQIAMMGDIYSRASVVIIYLGEPEPADLPYMEELHRYNIKRMKDASVTRKEPRHTDASDPNETLQVLLPHEACESLGDKPIIGAESDDYRDMIIRFQATFGATMNFVPISGLPRREWEELESRFANVFIAKGSLQQPAIGLFTAFAHQTFQEVALTHLPIVIWGPLAAHIDLYQRLLAYVERKDVKEGIDDDCHFAAIMQIRNRAKELSRDLTMLLFETRMRQATQPKDKIFGVLALADEITQRILNPVDLYSSPLAEVYQKAATHCLVNEKQFLIWGATKPRSTSAATEGSMPTWIADWRCPYAQPLSKWCRNLPRTTPEIRVESSISGKHFCVKALLLDRIVSCADTTIHPVYEPLPGTQSHWAGRIREEIPERYAAPFWDIVPDILGDEVEYTMDYTMDDHAWNWDADISQLLDLEKTPIMADAESRSIIQRLFSGDETVFEGYQGDLTTLSFMTLAAYHVVWEYVSQALKSGGRAYDNQSKYRRFARQVVDENRKWSAKPHKHPSMQEKSCFVAYHAVGICPEWALPGDIICYLGGAPVLHLLRPVYAEGNKTTEGASIIDSWLLDGKAVIGFNIVGEGWFHDYMNLPLVKAWEAVREKPLEHADLAKMFVNIELI